MDDDNGFTIRQVDHAAGFGNQSRREKKDKKRGGHSEEDEAQHHFNDLIQSVETAHELLIEKKSPYRFCVYREGGNVFIDMVMLDEAGAVVKTVKKNITHAEFNYLITHIESLDGLIIDYTV